MRLAPQIGRSRLQRWIAVFAMVVIAGLGFVQAVHLHEDLAPSSVSHTHCALCMFSHSPAIVSAARSAPAPIGKSTALVIAETQLHSRLLLPAASIRPPPVL
jgi:hypothetical protein